MNQQNYHCSIATNGDVNEAWKNIAHVSEWWTGNIEGSTARVNDKFTVHFGNTFVDFLVIESVPGERLVWKVTNCCLHWLSDKEEWKNTTLEWEVLRKKNATEISFTHVGLVPQIPCYNDCRKGWDFYIKESLRKLIAEGKGMPETPKLLR